MHVPKPLTGWLILLIIVLGFGSLGGGTAEIRSIKESYQALYDTHPSLPNAVMIFQVVFAASIVSGIYTAWVLYRRVPGSLPGARNALLLTVALRILAYGTIPLFGGLSADAANELIRDWIVMAIVGLAVTASWYLYLCRSKEVQEIYAPSPSL